MAKLAPELKPHLTSEQAQALAAIRWQKNPGRPGRPRRYTPLDISVRMRRTLLSLDHLYRERPSSHRLPFVTRFQVMWLNTRSCERSAGLSASREAEPQSPSGAQSKNQSEQCEYRALH
jgi:hypothetical protein